MKPKLLTATLAAFALAALLGVLLPSDTAVHAADPVFDTGLTLTINVKEDTPPGVNIGRPISATDVNEIGDPSNSILPLEYGNTLTYSLEGEDAASFDIDSSTGQLITKAPLDAETEISYSVTVRVDDGETRDRPVTQPVTINVTAVAEPAAAPTAPTVVSGPDDDDTTNGSESTTALKVIWHPPENTGGAINDYEVEYKEYTETDFINHTVSGTDTTTTITELEPDTTYQVRVRASNGEGLGPWSLVGTGSTNRANNAPPMFPDTLHTGGACPTDICETEPENQSSGQDVTARLTVTDANSLANIRTYRLDGPDKDSFDFDTSSLRIRTKRGVTYDFESQSTYYVTLVVFDGHGGSDALGVRITLEDDTGESPLAPSRPTVRPTEKLSTRLDVSWNAPDNTGRPDITGYIVHYREGTTGTFTTTPELTGDAVHATKTSFTIVGPDAVGETPAGLKPGTSYQVQVRAVNDEGPGAWSAIATGKTSAANRRPDFGDDTLTRQVRENTLRNTRIGQAVGARVSANQLDSDRLTYSLGPVLDNDDDPVEKTDDHPDFFTIDESTGQIRTKVLMNHEAATGATGCGYDSTAMQTTCTYMVAVRVWDGLNTHRVPEETEVVDDTVRVTIQVLDEQEPSAAPAVTVTAPGVGTTLVVAWNTPDNTGPAIANYELEYSTGGTTATVVVAAADTITYTIGSSASSPPTDPLTADTRYTVRVRAQDNAIGDGEGAGAWSRSVSVSTNKANNNAPVFAATTADRSVDESTSSGQDIGGVVEAMDDDIDDGDRLTYSLEGPDAGLFTIDRNTGQLKTKSALNHEDPACGYDSGQEDDGITECAYQVRVKVADLNGGSGAIAVEITVVDQDGESPSNSRAPRVTKTADSGRSLEVSWDEPQNPGPPITDYDIRYRKYVQGRDDIFEVWQPSADNSTKRSVKITGLDPDTSYEVQVRAENAEGMSDWSSPVARAATGKGNRRPVFDDTRSLVTLVVQENTPGGRNVGSPVEADDEDGNRLTYSLEGPGASSFTIVSSSGQIRTRSGVTYDYESREFYSLTVKVDDGSRTDNSGAAKSVTVEVRDEIEVPLASPAPRVTGMPGSTTSVGVTWEEPGNTGDPIDRYQVEYRRVGSNVWGDWSHDGVDRSTVITGLEPGTRYEVRVRAHNERGWSQDWSRSGTGAPNRDTANRNPSFSGGTRSFSVAENTGPNFDIGDPVPATDPDGDTLTYFLEGADAASFDILSTTAGGQLRTSAPLNHEEKSSHSVTVRVTDGRGGSSTANVTIRVTDVPGEAPSAPEPPTVTALSSTSLQVIWTAPENEGPPVTDYDYRYRGPTGSWTDVTGTTITGTTVTITGLTANTSYDVDVRAKNAEGTSDWSGLGFGTTSPPGANSVPAFSDTSAERSVSAVAPAGTSVGDPFTATDDDSGDTLTYTLDGTDAAAFDIRASTGQIVTKSGVTLSAGNTYAVRVVASDGKDTGSIDVTITVVNLPPAFASSTATRSVAASATSGTNVGAPVTATDADTGDTVTYSLEGADAGLFAITGGTGQITVGAGTTLDRASYTVEVVATDGAGDTARVTVTIDIITNNAPAFASATATRSVSESASAGASVGAPVTATDADADRLTYTLGGADAALFAIGGSTGQITVGSGTTLDYETRTTYTVVVHRRRPRRRARHHHRDDQRHRRGPGAPTT